jgi:hypothetical protein
LHKNNFTESFDTFSFFTFVFWFGRIERWASIFVTRNTSLAFNWGIDTSLDWVARIFGTIIFVVTFVVVSFECTSPFGRVSNVSVHSAFEARICIRANKFAFRNVTISGFWEWGDNTFIGRFVALNFITVFTKLLRRELFVTINIIDTAFCNRGVDTFSGFGITTVFGTCISIITADCGMDTLKFVSDFNTFSSVAKIRSFASLGTDRYASFFRCTDTFTFNTSSRFTFFGFGAS